MWKTLLLLACVASSIIFVCCDDDNSKSTAEANPTGDTGLTEDTKSTDDTTPTGATGPSDSVDSGSNDAQNCGQPPRCGKNEEYDNCTYTGCIPQQCSQIGFPGLKCEKCRPRCVCKSGYVRNDDGICILIADCPSCGGDKNAQQGCGNHCGRTCADYGKPPHPCPPFCIFNGCDCRPGFYYDGHVKACVKPKDCTPVCQFNEEFSSCINGGCDARNCSQVGKLVPCVKLAPESCIKGCVCVTGYLRASNGTCVPKDQCTPKCEKPNEVYDVCPAPCPPKLCNVDEATIRCKASPKPGDPECKPGCRCADTFYRNATGTCVPRNKCEKPLKCDCPNEVYDSCPAICPPQVCNPPVILCPRNPDYGDPNCRPGCVCQDGYVRNDARECIPKDQCPKCTGQNEYFETCIQGCSNQTCDSIGKKYFCPLQKGCKSGCRCNTGFYRNVDNVCVPESECPPTCPANEEYSTCINGGCDARNCSQVGKQVPCVKIDPKYCIKGCVCVAGYLRDSNGTCVPKDQCTPKCEKPNEVYDVCPAPCPPKLCNVDEAVIRCKAPPKPGDPECKPGCRCADTYYRNATGTCVPKNKCEKPLKCDCPNEVYDSCPAICPPQECGVNPALILCVPNPKYGDPNCKPGCVCQDGFVRNAARKCIPRDECPLTCPANEEYSTCINGGCSARNCSQREPVPCVRIDPKYCIKGCVCVAGYLRDSNGICVPKDQCTPKCEKPNEVYDVCPAPCPPKLCNVDEATIRCKAPPKPGDPECKPGCRCADTFYRNATGTCVPKNKCEKPLKCDCPNEVYDSCPAICPPQVCNPPLILCPRNPNYGDPNCRPGCVCQDGYVRNDARECIPKDQCPKCTGQNEYFEKCIQGCSNQTCDSIGKKYSCPIQKGCKSGCRCNPGFYRNANNVCVPESECSQTCGPNAHWEQCITDCSNQTCNDIGKSYSCPAQLKCKSGCRCDEGYWRDENNVCIPARQCPTPSCPDGAFWEWCPTVRCEGDYCPKTRNSPQTCPVGIVCDTPRCVCGINRKMDRRNRKCIPIPDCPPFECDDNEEYQACSSSCPGENCSDYINKTKCPRYRIGIVVNCRPQCKCIKGYYRNANGSCIPACDCPKQPTTGVTTPPPTKPATGKGLTGLLDGITAFTGTCLYNRIQSGGLENIIMSAMSVVIPIAELCLYSEGPALDQCLKTLNLTDKQDIRDAFPLFAAFLEQNQTKVNFSTAAKYYSNIKYPLSEVFKKDAGDIFHAEAQELDFAKNIIAAAIINDWVKSKTNNLIKDLVAPDMLSAITQLVLVNAIYFKGNWMYKFNKNNTKDEDFYLPDNTTKKTKMMYQMGKFNYFDDSLLYKVIELPYDGSSFSMMVVLPNKSNGLLQVAEELQDPQKFDNLRQRFYLQKVEVYIPKFEIDTTTDLKDLLQASNMTQWFNCQNPGLTGIMADPSQNICITTAIQKANCRVDEEGSEAAAANVIIGVRTTAVGPPPEPPKIFRADHGFLYYILKDNRPVFSGAFRVPK